MHLPLRIPDAKVKSERRGRHVRKNPSMSGSVLGTGSRGRGVVVVWMCFSGIGRSRHNESFLLSINRCEVYVER